MLKRVKVFDIAFWNVITNNGSTRMLGISKGNLVLFFFYGNVLVNKKEKKN